MADDIDIEEHDIMDNPQLKNIFPCITNIKSEVIDYEDENEYQEYIDHSKIIKTEPIEYESNPNINSNVIIFGTKPSTPQPLHKPSSSTYKESTTNQISYEEEEDDDGDYSDDTDEDPDIIPCSVVLEDWHSLLINNSCFCTECDILFPTPNTFESHRMTAHSFLVAVSRNTAVKSTSKGSIQDNVVVGRNKAIKSTSKSTKKGYDQINNLKRPDLMCQHCNLYYPSKADLIMHLNSLLPHTEQLVVQEKPLHVKRKFELSEEELYIMCSICYAFYKREENFLSHILLHHGIRCLKKVMTPFNPYCKHCKICIRSPKKFNCHIKVHHTEMYLMRNNYEGGRYQCHMCKQTFPSANAEQIHRWLKHPINVKNCDSSFRKALLLGKTNNPLKSQAHVCASDTKALKNLKKNKNKTVHINITTSDTKKYIPEHEPINTSDNKLVPKSHLFKCDKCQIHFISPSAAFEHTNHCALSKGDWKCKPCKRKFKITDRQMHINQHALNARFKVIVISEDILARVLNRCGKCNVCFDDTTFSKYHGSGCKPCPSVECEVCLLQIHKFNVVSHSRTHTELKLKKNDFIITDYHNIGDLKSNSPNIIADSKLYRNVTYNKVYYCLNCKTYTTRRRLQDGHHKGDCVGRKGGKELCRLCGLVFSKKGIVTHKAYHKMFNIKLDNLIIVNILNGKRIRPPLPEFMLCSDCQVYFVSHVALQYHVCNTEEHKSCQFCHKKFSDLAYKLHLPFHKLTKATTAFVKTPLNKITVKGKSKSLALVGLKTFVKEKQKKITTPIHDLIKKYESLVTVWNILYRCQTCDIVFDSYDSIVEHCQDHFCNMENYNLNIKYCVECNLKFADICYSRHEQLHSQNSVSIESFIFIDCDYSLLLSDKWQTIFNKLTKDQLHQVMSKSIYNEIRDVRMSLISDGDLGSIYKCSLCNVSVNLQFVVDHVRNRECNACEDRPICQICDVAFSQNKSAKAHKQKHNLSEMPFRVVSFNDPKTFFIDEALIKSAKADDLKFVRCQYCGKLINKSVYGMHMYKHNYSKRLKLLKNQALDYSNSVIPRVKGRTIDQKGVFRYYICKNCTVAGLAASKVSKHICCDVEKKKCAKCRVFIRGDSSTLWRHKKIHENYPTLSYKTVKITYFDPKEVKTGKDITKLYQNKLLAAPIPVAKSATVPLLPKFNKRLRFVRCAQCTKCVKPKSFRSHQCKANAHILKCHLCGINIDKRHYRPHLQLHKKFSFTKNDITVTTFDYKSGNFLNKVGASSSPTPKAEAIEHSNLKRSQDTQFHSDINKHDCMRVFKCTECTLLFVCRANLLEHVAGTRGVCDGSAGIRCEYCNLNFHSSDIKQHKTVQFCRTRKVSLINVCTLVLKTADPNDDNNWLSYCKKCDFYNTNAMKSHFDSKHKSVAITVRCLKCGVRFAKCCIKKHNIFHHGSVDIPLSDLNVEVMEDCTLEEVGYVSRTHDDYLLSSRGTAEENNMILRIRKGGSTYAGTPKTKKDVPDIYRCSTCNLHFINRLTLKSHKSKNEHYVIKIPCKMCGMPFSRSTIAKHLAMHEFTDTFNVIDLSESPKQGSKYSSDASLNTSDTIDMSHRNSIVSYDEREETTSSSHPSTPSQSNVPAVIKVQEAADSSGTSSNEISSTNSISHATSTSELKLFKCGECDVYFMTAECCSLHTENHSPLDPTEYIACKICDLQFLNRTLDEHMKGHRDKTFNIDTLVVDEYQPNEHNVRIDTYSAIDRLKSKLVSTTTESD